MQQFTMRVPDDFHVHLRDGDMLRTVAPHTARQFKRAVVMPNLLPPVLTEMGVREYREKILAASQDTGFEPLMTIQITEDTMPETILAAKKAGAVAGKVYPRGMTTNSENGVADYDKLDDVFSAMQECGMLALFHGESPKPNVFCLDREEKFLNILYSIRLQFDRLKIVLEHCTTQAAIDWITAAPANVAATITVHHLFLTLNDVIGDKLEPHHFCKPVAKREEDRAALVQAVMSGNPKFFFGSDSAPWIRTKKECMSGCAGIFTAPVAIPLLLDLFEQYGETSKLEDFCSGFGADFYGLPRNEDVLQLERRTWTVPGMYDGVVPFRAGEKIHWQVVNR